MAPKGRQEPSERPSDVLSAFSRCLDSELVSIHAGGEEETFAVHKEVLLRSGSPSLRSMFDPRWRESTNKTVDWNHTNAETVRRVLTFLYLRDYHSPNPILRRQPSGIDSAVSEDFQSAYERHDDVTDIEDDADDTDYADDMDTDDGTEPSERFPSPTLSMMANEERLTVTRGKSKAPNQIKDQIFPFSDYSYINTLLVHAQVYCFAQYHQLDALQDLAVHRMTGLLANIDCSIPNAVDELSDLVEYVYNDTDGGRNDMDRMRQLVSRFCAMKYRFLFRGRFKELVCQGGDFTRDVLKGLSTYLGQQRRMTTLRADEVNRLVSSLNAGLVQRNEIIGVLQNQLAMYEPSQ